MYIETPRMIIRNFTKEDTADLYDIFGEQAMRIPWAGARFCAIKRKNLAPE